MSLARPEPPGLFTRSTMAFTLSSLRISRIHLRNVRGSLATAGGFEETLLDDGDMNMFKILLELKKQGFNGCINPDHIPAIHGDSPSAHQGLAYSIGYIKALYAALAVEE